MDMAATCGLNSMESQVFVLNPCASPWFPSEPVAADLCGVQSHNHVLAVAQWACWVPVQNPSCGQGFPTVPFTNVANAYAHNRAHDLPFINHDQSNATAGKTMLTGSWDDSPWTGPAHGGTVASHNAAKPSDVSNQDHELSSTACDSTSSSRVSTSDSETSPAGKVPIDDITMIPADLFAEMLCAGQQARTRGQHRYSPKGLGRARQLQRSDILDAKVVLRSSTRTRLPCPSFPPPPAPPMLCAQSQTRLARTTISAVMPTCAAK